MTHLSNVFTMMAADVFMLPMVLLISSFISTLDGQCVIPDYMRGTFFSIENGDDVTTVINQDSVEGKNTGSCTDIRLGRIAKNAAVDQKEDVKLLLHVAASRCYKCLILLYRTENILQYMTSNCITPRAGNTAGLDEVCDTIQAQTILSTYFRMNLKIMNCKDTFEGVFQFSYEYQIGGGICNSSGSTIEACQEPGSPYVDNQVFKMTYTVCPGLSQSKDDLIRFQCMGMWRDDDNNIMAAVANLGEFRGNRFKFRCLLTRRDQQRTDNKARFSMTELADCTSLKSPFDGPVKLILRPVLGKRHLEDLTPTCNLPSNYSGVWFTSGEYDSKVFINSTHIHFHTNLDQFNVRDTYFACQQTRDSRYMMTAVTVGKCDVDYICMDFLPRHQNIIRYRMGKPFRLTFDEMQDKNYLVKKFRESCSWHAFTFNRDEIEWKYNYFVLYEPSPVKCPVAGKYKFVQEGAPQEYYYTRTRTVTAFPWHRIPCDKHEQDFAICTADTTKMFIDADRCQTVDQNTRPVNIYDAPDRTLTCVGYWMEDYRSYLITFDLEDAVSRFRCWVYERLNWKDLVISRATRANCGVKQTAWSKDSSEGASLRLRLYENERVHDQCPRVFLFGEESLDTDPYQLKYMGGSKSAAAGLKFNVVTFMFISLVAILNFRFLFAR